MSWLTCETWDEKQDGLREAAILRVDWRACPFAKDAIPIGVWGMNSQGNIWLAVPDGSYYYFNADGSVYHKNAPVPETPKSVGSSIYMSPSLSLHYTPSSQEQEQTGGKYFIGYDWKTEERLYYWEDGEGFIVRTLKRNLDFSTPLEQHDVRTYTNKHGVQRVIIVDDDWNYVGKNKMIMEELKDLPEEVPIELPMTPNQHSTIDAVYVRPEITITAENPAYLPMTLSRETELGDESRVTIKTENSSSLATPADSPIYSSAEEEIDDETVDEEVPENGRDGAGTQSSVANPPTIERSLALPTSKTDSRPRDTRITRSAAADPFPFRVTKATARKDGRFCPY